MITSRAALITALTGYESAFSTEANFAIEFLALLKDERCYHRDHLPGHITGSAWIIDHTRTHVLLTHHAKLDKWLQPGGHADGDEDVSGVAMREANEETGLLNLTAIGNRIFDIDIHTIPGRKDFPEHLHYDVRFIFQALQGEDLIISEESHDLKWVPLNLLENYNTGESLLRMKEKTLRFQLM